ncbi:MAG: ABC transporter ATP-binding protein, partial [Spirochaetales bacterium]|nr:ABC transporter ATP-binding protein [Spirochaetales bacterium]
MSERLIIKSLGAPAPRASAPRASAAPVALAPALALRDVTIRYDGREALRNLTVAIEPGQFVLVTGPSGCGKSTLALAACGLIPHARAADLEGSVAVFGSDTRTRPVHALAGQIGIVFQDPSAQLFHGVAEEEVAFAPRNLGLPGDEVDRRVAWAMGAVGISHLTGRLTQGLSAGERQRLAVAAALSLQPRVLVLDEPTANLDWQG